MNHCKSINQRTQATSHGGALRNAASIDAKSVVSQLPEGVSHSLLSSTSGWLPLLDHFRLHACLLCARGTERVSQPRVCAGRREGRRSAPSSRSRLCLRPPYGS